MGTRHKAIEAGEMKADFYREALLSGEMAAGRGRGNIGWIRKDHVCGWIRLDKFSHALSRFLRRGA
jgi:hypothetical protein